MDVERGELLLASLNIHINDLQKPTICCDDWCCVLVAYARIYSPFYSLWLYFNGLLLPALAVERRELPGALPLLSRGQ
jgi:hypothetical protein